MFSRFFRKPKSEPEAIPISQKKLGRRRHSLSEMESDLLLCEDQLRSLFQKVTPGDKIDPNLKEQLDHLKRHHRRLVRKIRKLKTEETVVIS